MKENIFEYIIFNKPYGVLSQFSSDTHKTLDSFELPPKVYPVGRLDKDSEGLLLLSNDGKFIENFLLNHERSYWVQVDNIPTQDNLKILSQGVKIKTGMTKPCHIKLIDPPKLWQRDPPIRVRKSIPTSWLEITLKEGKNRQVRKMTATINCPTLRLVRCRLGKISLKNIDLKLGQWIKVKKSEII